MSSQHTDPETHSTIEESQDTSGGAIRILVYALLLILLAAGVWYLFGGQTTAHTSHEEHGEATTPAETEKMPEATATGKVDTLGNYIYELGKTVVINLPSNGGKLEVGEFSTENKLYTFLADSTAKIDTAKGNWFEFTNVRFKTGGKQIDSASMGQLKNVAAIIKAFPKASFKIGGYTDNTGDSANNIALSQSRADAVLAELKKQVGKASSFTTAKGYGPEYPVGDNATAEGKAQNRRVAVNVKSK